jgi:hypothetical protein
LDRAAAAATERQTLAAARPATGERLPVRATQALSLHRWQLAHVLHNLRRK